MTLFSAITTRIFVFPRAFGAGVSPRAFGARPDPAGASRTNSPAAGPAPTCFGFAAPAVIGERHLPPDRPEFALPEFAVTNRRVAVFARLQGGWPPGVAMLALGLARLMFAGSDSFRTGLVLLILNVLLRCHGAAPSRVVAGPGRARPMTIAIVVLAIGLPGLTSEAAAQTGPQPAAAAAGSVLSIAPDMRGSASQFLVGQVFSPAPVVPTPVVPAPPEAADGKSDTPENRPAKKWRVALGLGLIAGPKYPGSGEISAAPAPSVSVTYDDRFFVSSRQGIGAYLARTGNFKLGVALGIAEDTRFTGKDVRLRGLPKVKPGGQASLFAEYDAGPVVVEAAARARIGAVNGVSATLGASYRIRLTPAWSVSVGPELKVQSASLNDAFFGVTPAASLRAASYGNKIRPYAPGAGIAAASLEITSRYRASARWTLLAKAGLGGLVGRDGDSPLTRQRFQPEVGAFAMCGF